MQSRDLADEHECLDLLQLDNDFYAPCESAGATLREIDVWGGAVFNCGESALSRTIDSNASTLRSVTYKPDSTKGGVLVRPKYHRGDRSGTQDFPVLTDMAIRLTPLIVPSSAGWRTPALRRFTLLLDPALRQRGGAPGEAGAKRTIFHEKEGAVDIRVTLPLCSLLALHDPAAFVQRLHANAPKLEQVSLELCTSEDRERTRLRLLSVHLRVPWAVQRLFHLVALKPDPAANGLEAVELCHHALRQALPVLLRMLQGSYAPEWEVRTPRAPPLAASLAKLGLHPPPDGAWPGVSIGESRPDNLVEGLVGWLRLACVAGDAGSGAREAVTAPQ